MHDLGRTLVILGLVLLAAGTVILGLNRLHIPLGPASRGLQLAWAGMVFLLPPGDLHHRQHLVEPASLGHWTGPPVALNFRATMLDSGGMPEERRQTAHPGQPAHAKWKNAPRQTGFGPGCGAGSACSGRVVFYPGRRRVAVGSQKGRTLPRHTTRHSHSPRRHGRTPYLERSRSGHRHPPARRDKLRRSMGRRRDLKLPSGPLRASLFHSQGWRGPTTGRPLPPPRPAAALSAPLTASLFWSAGGSQSMRAAVNCN